LVITRPLRLGDAAEMAEVLRRNRDFLAPWDPVRDEDYFTEPGQRIVIEGLLDGQQQGSALPLAIVHNGAIVGRITLTAIARGPFQSCQLGYWVAAEANGRGLATAATQ
jgi:[ribosomal protein S5]-alanine N-acetyltransferase